MLIIRPGTARHMMLSPSECARLPDGGHDGMDGARGCRARRTRSPARGRPDVRAATPRSGRPRCRRRSGAGAGASRRARPRSRASRPWCSVMPGPGSSHRQEQPRLAEGQRHRHDHLRQRVVQARGHRAHRSLGVHVGEQRVHERRPVHDEVRRVPRPELPRRLSGREGERIGVVHARVHQLLELHRRLPFEPHHLGARP